MNSLDSILSLCSKINKQLLFLKSEGLNIDELIKGNNIDNKIQAKIVEGIDLDSDGLVDDIEILE